jgi:beta-galactosidase GanA
MVQVENEIGMIPTARDHSALADSLSARPVPSELLSYLGRHRDALAPELRARWDSLGRRMSGTWQEVFGSDARGDEVFMAWYFARHAERVTAAGKAEYALPMYVNAALIRPGYEPGRYVSAGPLPHLIDVWRAAAPSIDFLAPDIYFPNFAEWTAKYVRSGNALFVPENGFGAQSAINALYAFGAHDAIGYSPFAIESADSTAARSLAQSYELLDGLTPLVLANQGRGTMAAVMPPAAFDGTVNDAPQDVQLGAYHMTVSFQSYGTGASHRTGGAIIVALAPDEFIIAGGGVTVTFVPAGLGAPIAGILRAQEGRYRGGQWVGARSLNGDQTHQGRHIQLAAQSFTAQRVKLYRYR